MLMVVGFDFLWRTDFVGKVALKEELVGNRLLWLNLTSKLKEHGCKIMCIIALREGSLELS
jgi:hypothetical protein